MLLDANTTWFKFTAAAGDFGVYSFEGIEEVNEPYQFTIELVSRSANVEINSLLCKPALLSILDRSGAERLVHGLIRQMEQLHTGNRFTHYRVVLVPRLWYLHQIIDHRIFQNLTVIEIIQQILKEQGFLDEESDFILSRRYEAREYCVQYGETYLHFITRICEEEGIYFYFKHQKTLHCLYFCDFAGGPKIDGESDLRFYEGSGQSAATTTIARLRLQHSVSSNVATYREWNFTKPKLDLTTTKEEPNYEKAPAPAGMLLEQYHYPHMYGLRAQGEIYADLQLSRQLTFARWIECQTDASRFLPGHTFAIHKHARADINTAWWIASVRHNGEQPGVLEQDAPSERGWSYNSYVKAIPASTRFVPECVHPKTRILGTQTAIVTGPEGEEIFTDQYGRVTVQFFWDREGKWDEKTTCWIRVAQGWAGSHYGAMAIPRIGHEVVVTFLEGDPDRPLITGSVYHALNMPPYNLPEHKTRTTIKSQTIKGNGYNEIRFEDIKGLEQIYIHGQHDQDIIIENDSREWVKGQEHLLVGKDRVEEIAGDTSSQANQNRMEGTGGKKSVTVGGDEARQVGGAYHLKVNNTVYIQGMSSGVMEMEDITIKAPGGFVRIDSSGVTIEGKVVNINTGGSPDFGIQVQAAAPRSAAIADSRDTTSGKKSVSSFIEANKAPRGKATEGSPHSYFGGNAFTESSISDKFGISSINIKTLPSSLSGSIADSLASILPLMHEAKIEVEYLKNSPEFFAQEWRKAVLDAKQTAAISNKMEVINTYIHKNVALSSDQLSKNLQAPSALLQSGRGTDLECAVAKLHTLRESGVPADSMRVIATNHGNMLTVRDGAQTLVIDSDFAPGMPMVRDVASLSADIKPLFGFNSNAVFNYAPIKS